LSVGDIVTILASIKMPNGDFYYIQGNAKNFTPNSNPATTPAMWDNDAYPAYMGTEFFAVEYRGGLY